jgi:hypothetical protein
MVKLLVESKAALELLSLDDPIRLVKGQSPNDTQWPGHVAAPAGFPSVGLVSSDLTSAALLPGLAILADRYADMGGSDRQL